MGLPPMRLLDDSYDYDDSTEGTPDLLSSILKQMLGGESDIEITPIIESSEGSSGESSVDSVEVSVPAQTTRYPEFDSHFHGNVKEQRVPEEVSYRRAP